MGKSPAIFLDRDGTINEEMGYINHVDRFRIFPFVSESIKIFKELGFKVIVITNQSGIARGYFSIELLEKVHGKLNAHLNVNGTNLDGIYYCPHHPTAGKSNFTKECNCRKPKTGMIELAQKDHDIDIEQSYMIGDRFKDMQFAKNLRVRSGLVLTGYGKGEYQHQKSDWPFMPDLIESDLKKMALKIKKEI